ATVAGAVVFGVLGSIPSLDWLQPYLLTNTWTSLTDVLRDPMPVGGLVHGMAEAGCYLLIGLSLALARVVTKDGGVEQPAGSRHHGGHDGRAERRPERRGPGHSRPVAAG